MSILMFVFNLCFIVAAPLWMFRHAIAASRRGMSYLDYLNHRIDVLRARVVANELKKASLRHPRRTDLMRTAKYYGLACVGAVILMLAGGALGGTHGWVRTMIFAGAGGAIGCFLNALFYVYKARKGTK